MIRRLALAVDDADAASKYVQKWSEDLKDPLNEIEKKIAASNLEKISYITLTKQLYIS